MRYPKTEFPDLNQRERKALYFACNKLEILQEQWARNKRRYFRLMTKETNKLNVGRLNHLARQNIRINRLIDEEKATQQV